MRAKLIKKLTLTAIFTALVAVATMVITIPMAGSGGYVNFGDTIIFVAASFLGPVGGFISGAIGSSIADLVYAPKWIPITFIVKGLEGLLCGLLIIALKKIKLKNIFSYAIAMIVAACVMVTGYFFGGFLLEGLSTGSLTTGFAVAVADIPFNLIQGGVSVVVGLSITLSLGKIRYIRNFVADINTKDVTINQNEAECVAQKNNIEQNDEENSK
ncbi:MAG: ECF transporter S component [Clostridia bacterium]|nr:ECF transporter S component [Clostridia bacterium]